MTEERIVKRIKDLQQELILLHERAGSGEDCSIAIIDEINQVSMMRDAWEAKLIEEDVIVKNYYVWCSVQPHHAGFGMYQSIPGDGRWDDADFMLGEIGNSVDQVLELGVDDLPEDVEDIRGKIYNEPGRMFAAHDTDGWFYFGVKELEYDEEETDDND